METSGSDAGQRRELERPPLGGGEAYAHEIAFPKSQSPAEPFWTFESVADVVRPQIEELRARAEQLSAEQLGSEPRVIVKAATLPNFLAASHYPEDFFRATGLLPVGSRSSTGTRRLPKASDEPDQPAKTFLLSADTEALGRLQGVYESPMDFESARADALKFSGFSLEGFEDVLKMGTGELPPEVEDQFSFEAILHPQLISPGEVDPVAGQRVREEFDGYVESLGGAVNSEFARFEGNMWYLPVLLPREPAVLGAVASFTQLRVLRPTPTFRGLRSRGEAIGEVEPLIDGLPPVERRIALFDGGVDVEGLGLGNWVTEHHLTDRPRLTAHHEHGVGVTSAALFGSLDSDCDPPSPHTPVDHFRIWPLPRGLSMDAELPWVLEQIEAIVALGQHKIFVITLAPGLTAEDSEPHLWTATLDRLAFDNDVLFVVAAGNEGELADGLNRILVPADLINGLSVGSCSSESGLAVRDSYSCVGPGRPGAMTAPTGVQFGGNLDARAFAALEPDGDVGTCEGTSYSAPLVARGCAELDALLDGTSSANLLRTLAVHRAERPSEKQAKEEGSSSREVGYGRLPASYLASFEHRPNEVTIVYDGLVRRKPMLAVEIPVPEDIYLSEPNRLFTMRWTLGFFARVEPSNPVDYSSAGIKVVFRPHRAKFKYTNKKGESFGPIDVEKEPGVGIVFEEEHDAKRAEYADTAEQSGVAPEVIQRQYHGKWEGVARMDKRMQGKSLLDPRLDFHMLTREAGGLLKEADSLRYALAVSVIAPTGVDLYERTVAEAELLTPLTTSIPILVESAS